MQQIKHLYHLNLSVHNLQESMDWYQLVFGFQYVEGGTHSETKWAIIRFGEAMLCMNIHNTSGRSPTKKTPCKFIIFAFRIQEQQWLATV